MRAFGEFSQDTVVVPGKMQSNDSIASSDTTNFSDYSESIRNYIVNNQPDSSDSSQHQQTKTLLSKSSIHKDLTTDSIRNSPSLHVAEDKLIQVSHPVFEGFSLLKKTSDRIDYKPRQFWIEKSGNFSEHKQLEHQIHVYNFTQLNWTLAIGLIGISLLIILKVYYQKFVDQVFNTLFNYQLAEKLLREKNIIVRRAFLIMNTNFVLVFGLFIMLLSKAFNITITRSYFYDYLVILLIILTTLLLRLLVLYIAALLFDSMRTVVEHIHISYLVNKNLGLILLPLVFAAIYVTNIVSNVIIITGLVIFILANIYKLIRSFQIIIRNDVLIYYAILYLCTLELLPLAISIKVLISMG